MERVTFFTMATKSERGFPQYITSCTRYGIVPQVLGMDQPFKGLFDKIRLMREQLDRLGDDELVVMTDSYDLVFQKGSREIIHGFLLYNKPIVFSAQRGEGYLSFSNQSLPATPQPLYRSLNGGFLVARVNAARIMFDEAEKSEFRHRAFDDQELYYSWYAKNHSKAVVDYRNVLVVSTNLTAEEDLGYRNGLVYNTHTGAVPCAIHGYGGIDMTKIYKALAL